MNEPFLIHQISVFLIITIGFWLGFWVLLANKKARVNQWFFVITMLIILWSIFAYLGFTAVETEKATIWYRLSWGIASLFLLAAYFFTIYFPRKITENYFLSKVIIFLCSIFSFFSIFTDLVIRETIIKEWGAEIIFGPLGGFVFKGFSILLIFILLYYLFKKYFILEKKEKLKIQYVIVGTLIFALANIIFNVIFPLVLGTIKYYHFGGFSAIFLLGFFAYAIVKYQLFEIKVVLTQLLVGIMAIILLILPLLIDILWIRILLIIIFVLFCFMGYLLIKGVMREVKQKEILEQKVKERTKELQGAYEDIKKRKEELEKFHSLVIGREVKMVELKKRIRELEERGA